MTNDSRSGAAEERAREQCKQLARNHDRGDFGIPTSWDATLGLAEAAYDCGRREELEEAARLCKSQLDIVLAGASVTALSYEEVLQIVENAIRQRISAKPEGEER